MNVARTMMLDVRTPWVGLAALVAMFVIPYLPDWLFQGPRTVRHWPRRHICGHCGAPWTDEHACRLDGGGFLARLRGSLHRRRATRTGRELEQPARQLTRLRNQRRNR